MKKILILLLLPSFLSAQETAKDWLKKMNARYASATSLSLSFKADYFADKAQQITSSTMKGEVKYNGMNYYSDAMGEIVVANEKYTLLIDKTQKTITCLPGPGKKNETKSMAGGQPDSAWMNATGIKLLTTSGPSRRIEIAGDGSLFEKTEITINATTCEMEQVVFYYKKQENGKSPKLVVSYTQVLFNTMLNELDFSEKKYIRKKEGKLIASTAYSSYKIIDLTSGKLPE
jgi:outer membrane lipoprotein-sorting protein